MDKQQPVDSSSQSDGPRVDPGPLLDRLEPVDFDPAIWDHLASILFNDWTVKLNAYACVPRLVNNAKKKHYFPAQLFDLVTSIELRRYRKGSAVLPESLKVEYVKSLEDLAKIALVSLGESCSADKARRLLCLLALSKGLTKYAIALNEYSEQELGESFLVDDSEIGYWCSTDRNCPVDSGVSSMQPVENNPPAIRENGPKDESALRPHEFFLVRYVPDTIRGEFVNIGVVIREYPASDRSTPRAARVRITPNYTRVNRLFPGSADLSYLGRLENLIQDWIRDTVDQNDVLSSYFDTIRSQMSLTIQLTDPQGCLTSDIDAYLMFLMNTYVESHEERVARDSQWVYREFLKNQSFDTLHIHRAEQYTSPGDTLEFDCMYRTHTVSHIIQGIFIEEGLEPALAFAQRVHSLREGFRKSDGTSLEITVITELPPVQCPEENEAYDTYQFAVSVMQEAGILVRTVADLPMIAAEISRKLYQ